MDAEKLSAQNPWWSQSDAIASDEKVANVLKTGRKIVFEISPENAVLIGPRQLGKTTALKFEIYRKITEQNLDPRSILYYSFDTARSFEEIAEVIDAFVTDEKRKFLYLDEVGFVDGWQRAIKQFLDSRKAANARICVTGSSSINLKKELMPGRRIKFLEFAPLSFRAFLKSFGSDRLKRFLAENEARNFGDCLRIAETALSHFSEINKLFGIYLHTGGYPDAIFDYLDDSRISDSLYDVHWNAFVSDISKADKSVEAATAIVYGILESYASKINLSGIARMQGIKSHVTVREYLEAFEDLFVARSIFPMMNRRYVFRKERKVYFSDPFLYGLFAKKANSVDKGSEPKLVEGIAYNHLYRFVNRGKGVSEPKTAIGFYSGKREVDFVAGNFGFEVKWQNEASKADFPTVGIRNRVVLSKKALEIDRRGTSVVPLPLFLSAM